MSTDGDDPRSVAIAAPRVDAHHHVWDLTVRDQPWTADLPPLRRSFGLAELQPQLAAAGIDATVLVQTVTVAEETPELLALAAGPNRIAGVVGWVDLTAEDVADRLAALREAPGGDRLVAVRHQVQSEPDPAWLVRPEVVRGLRAVAAAGLAYDLVVLPVQLPAAVRAARVVPELRFVLDHAGKPDIGRGRIDAWRAAVTPLAVLPNVAVKLSGLTTEAGPGWSVEDLRPVADHLLATFGPQRTMWGSDWPVCTLRADYAATAAVGVELQSGLGADERAAVGGRTACAWYGLRPDPAPAGGRDAGPDGAS